MIAIGGVVIVVILVLAVILVFYLSGNRSRETQDQQKRASVGGDTPHTGTRATGRGDN